MGRRLQVFLSPDPCTATVSWSVYLSGDASLRVGDQLVDSGSGAAVHGPLYLGPDPQPVHSDTETTLQSGEMLAIKGTTNAFTCTTPFVFRRMPRSREYTPQPAGAPGTTTSLNREPSTGMHAVSNAPSGVFNAATPTCVAAQFWLNGKPASSSPGATCIIVVKAN